MFKVEVLKGFRMVLDDWVWGDGEVGGGRRPGRRGEGAVKGGGVGGRYSMGWRCLGWRLQTCHLYLYIPRACTRGLNQGPTCGSI